MMSDHTAEQQRNYSLGELLRIRGVIELLLAASAFIAYSGTLLFGFVYDDRFQIVGNRSLTSWSNVPSYFTHSVWYLIDPHLAPNYYRPIFLIWLKLCYSIFELSPSGWHLTSVALHMLATVQMFWLAQRLLKQRTAAALAALFFALHPIHVESVAWISGATDLLMFVTMVGTVLAFLRWQQTRSVIVYSGALIFATLALLSKEPAIVLPILLVASAWAALPEQQRLPKSDRLALVPFFALSVVYLALRQHILAGFSHNAAGGSVSEMLLSWPAVIVFYLRQLSFPIRLSLFHDLTFTHSASSRQFLFSTVILVVVVLAVVMAVRISRERRPAIAALIWLTVPLTPVLYLRVYSQGELVHDRYTYVASAGFVMLLILIGRSLIGTPQPRRSSRAAIAVTTVTLLFASLTIYNQTYWANELLLFTHAVKIAPNNFAANLNLGSVYEHRGDIESLNIARGLFLKLATANPNDAAANYNLGHTEFELQDYVNAETHLNRAIKADPRHGPWWMHFAGVELRLGKPAEAENAAREAIRLSPTEREFHSALGAILLTASKPSDAEQEFTLELQLHPDSESAREGLARLAATRVTNTKTPKN
jgi:protein O-mannosyl-transferase